jgi:hypothetical protein
MLVRIDAEFQSLIPPLAPDERGELEASLAREGCREALVVWTPEDGDGVPLLLDGHHRYAWCTRENKPFRLLEAMGIDNRDAAKIRIIQNQLGRRNIPDYERVRLGLIRESILKDVRERNQRANLKRGDKSPEGFNLTPRGKTREVVAKETGVSPATVRKVQVIEREADDATKESLRAGERSIHSVYQDLRPKPQPQHPAERSPAHTQEPITSQPIPENPLHPDVLSSSNRVMAEEGFEDAYVLEPDAPEEGMSGTIRLIRLKTSLTTLRSCLKAFVHLAGFVNFFVHGLKDTR